NNHWIRSNIMDELKPAIKDLHKLNQVSECLKPMKDLETVENVLIEEINLGEGIIHTKIDMEEELFFNILNEITGYKITGDHQILGLMNKLAQVKKEYDKIEKALVEAKEIGYGLVSPTLEELELEEPEIYRQGSRYGVKLQAKAPSLHVMRADITTEISPLIGSEKQSEELIEYFLSEFEEDADSVWDLNLFGKSLYDLVSEQFDGKLTTMPEDARQKLRKALEKILNDGGGGLMCIII